MSAVKRIAEIRQVLDDDEAYTALLAYLSMIGDSRVPAQMVVTNALKELHEIVVYFKKD